MAGDTLDTTAVSSGPAASVTSTLATVVRVRATMKAVNITDQHRPDSHNMPPARRILVHTSAPCHHGRITARLSAVKALRQNVISNARAASR